MVEETGTLVGTLKSLEDKGVSDRQTRRAIDMYRDNELVDRAVRGLLKLEDVANFLHDGFEEHSGVTLQEDPVYDSFLESMREKRLEEVLGFADYDLSFLRTSAVEETPNFVKPIEKGARALGTPGMIATIGGCGAMLMFGLYNLGMMDLYQNVPSQEAIQQASVLDHVMFYAEQFTEGSFAGGLAGSIMLQKDK